MRPHASGELVLALQPSARGLGYVLFEGPLSPYAWEVKDIRGPQKLTRLFKAAIELIDRFEPEVLILEDKQSSPLLQFCGRRRFERMMRSYAEGRGLDVYRYTRSDIRQCFSDAGVLTRRQIAEVIAGQIPAFKRLPRKRKLWQAESSRMVIFDAASLAMTYYARDALFRRSF